MRNIALLEWGPASLFYIQPRERIKLRTVWLDGGPIMPPFLSTMEEAKAYASDLHVRYALSAFEDLNGTIKNLRRCFGFPYQEYIGYINTLTRKHRARREHEILIDRLRRWAIFGNVDAVVWIDYAKANQPPGSFKMGPRDSRPFSTGHIEICNKIESGMEYIDHDGEESDAGWSDLEEDQGAGIGGTVAAGGPVSPTAAESRRAPKVIPLVSRNGCLTVRSPPRSGCSEPPIATATTRLPLSDGSPRRVDADGTVSRVQTQDFSPLSAGDGLSSWRTQNLGTKDEHFILRTMIQEEVKPPYGSIYKRSITPGPGYYGHPELKPSQQRDMSFGHRPAGRIDEVENVSKKLPGPGDYRAKLALAEIGAPLGRFGKADKLLNPSEAVKKLPFISALASASEAHGVHSPPIFHTVIPDARGFSPNPKFSFGKTRRPF